MLESIITRVLLLSWEKDAYNFKLISRFALCTKPAASRGALKPIACYVGGHVTGITKNDWIFGLS